MNLRLSVILLLLLLLLSSLCSCVGTAPAKEVRLIDSLNLGAYTYRYKNLDVSFEYAKKAYEEASLYSTGKAEACNNLGFCAFIQMNFDLAENMYKEVYTLTLNELELLIADVGLMQIYQRTAMNKEFYDYRNSAISRMKRIDEDRNLFVDDHEVMRLNYAYSNFFLVSAVYYYYLRQIPEAITSIKQIRHEEIQNDTNQLLYYNYIKGSAGLFENMSADEKRLNEFDYLFYTWQHATRGGYTYFEGNSMQGLANLMVSPNNLNFFLEKRSYRFSQFNLPTDTVLPLQLACAALDKFQDYNDIYQIADAYVTIAKYLNARGHYTEALDTLSKALDFVNLHHQLYYSSSDDQEEILEIYVEKDNNLKEINWITGKNSELNNAVKVKTVPEWISRIREQLSVSFAGLEMKIQSDYNRNIYLEILNYTRQDKESESRYIALKQEARQLNIILASIVIGVLLIILLFGLFNKRTRKRNRIYTSRLRLTLEICQKVTSSVPTDIMEEEDIVEAIIKSVLPDMEKLLHITDMHIYLSADFNMKENFQRYPLTVPDKESPIGVLAICTSKKLTKDDQALLHVINPYIAWTIDNGITLISLGNERNNLEKQKYVFEQHIARNKRENLIKKACLSIVNGIIPYIDRIINEVFKLKDKGYIHHPQIKKEKYQYIDELVTTINEYNDILALWIQMKQGSLSLNIENFALNELFSLILKGRKTFQMKQQMLEVNPTESVVKADKALTLFMINTLTENARKYTPQGGTIRIYAKATDEYIEISVEDNGRGLSEEDVAMIEGEKIYNSHLIGITDEPNNGELRQLKGSGFGLMNCKGIIEKYRKSNPIFQVCVFGVESKLNKGSRFFFRLPLGIRKTLTIILCCLFMPFSMAYSHPNFMSEQLLDEATAFADTAYYCNVIAEYELALQYADSAIHRLNQHHKKYTPQDKNFLTLVGYGTSAEIGWWNNMFESNYVAIMDIRNEAAIAFLALKKLDAYTYNNNAYESLFKLYSEDPSWEVYSLELERSTTNKKVGLGLCVLLLVASFIGYYFLYTRKRLTNRWNLEQVLDINKKVFSSSHIRSSEEAIEALQREENTLKEIPRKIVNEAFGAVNELIEIHRLGIAIYNDNTQRLELACKPEESQTPDLVTQSFEQQQILLEENQQAFPLIVEIGENKQCVGVLFLEFQKGSNQDVDRLLLELIARYIAVVVLNAVVKLAMRYRDIESAYEDTHRASWEDSMLHVQNMVLDNCLSTIKHETIYYPNKIKQIIGKLNNNVLSEQEESNCVDDISELIEYYKGIFTILSSCASRQLEEVTFRRTTIRVADLLYYAGKYFKKAKKNFKKEISLLIDTDAGNLNIVGDLNQLHFLLENLIDEALSVDLPGTIQLKTATDGDFIRFLFTDERREKEVEELNQLFYPNLTRMTSDEKGKLNGTEYLICKQIIRDHDEFAGRRGCRINAEPAPGNGFTVYFTLPGKRSKKTPL